jgi:hypothetical protein
MVQLIQGNTQKQGRKMSLPICIYCEKIIKGKAHKDYGYYPEIRYYCQSCADGEWQAEPALDRA